jgi:hypothetical protein
LLSSNILYSTVSLKERQKESNTEGDVNKVLMVGELKAFFPLKTQPSSEHHVQQFIIRMRYPLLLLGNIFRQIISRLSSKVIIGMNVFSLELKYFDT